MTDLVPTVDAELAAAFEGAEADACRAFCTAAAEVHVGAGIRVLEGAGGVGLYYGPSDPLNSVKGAGLRGPVNIEEWNALEQAFHATGSPVVIDLCPLADAAFVQVLVSRGYRIGSFETVTFRPVKGDVGSRQAAPSIKVSLVDTSDPKAVREWTRVLDVGFADGGDPIKMAVDFGRVRAHMAAHERPGRTSMLMATVDGRPAGGAALSFARARPRADGSARPLIAFMSGAAVLPEFRRRGIQSALTRERLALAARHECQWATISVLAGSGSHRNAGHAGFQVAYTRPQMILAAPTH